MSLRPPILPAAKDTIMRESRWARMIDVEKPLSHTYLSPTGDREILIEEVRRMSEDELRSALTEPLPEGVAFRRYEDGRKIDTA